MSKSLFAQLLASSKEAIEAIQIPFKENAAKLDAQQEINKIESEVAQLDLEISKKKATYPLNMRDVLDMKDKRDLKLRRLNNTKELYTELFEVSK